MKVSEVAKATGAEWQSLSEHEKKPFVDQAEALKAKVRRRPARTTWQGPLLGRCWAVAARHQPLTSFPLPRPPRQYAAAMAEYKEK